MDLNDPFDHVNLCGADIPKLLREFLTDNDNEEICGECGENEEDECTCVAQRNYLIYGRSLEAQHYEPPIEPHSNS